MDRLGCVTENFTIATNMKPLGLTHRFLRTAGKIGGPLQILSQRSVIEIEPAPHLRLS